MTGISETEFAPNESTTRAMLVTILWRLEGAPLAKGKNFEDVQSDAYYYNAVLWAANNKIVNGYNDNMFGSNDAVTREQLAAIMYRYASFKNYDVSKEALLDEYADRSQISEYALKSLQWANANGIITGMSNTILAPKEDVKRCQAATVLKRFCENIADGKNKDAAQKGESEERLGQGDEEMFNRNKHNEPGKLLFDYYDAQAGLPVEPGYDEITLTATENSDKLQMDVYHRPTGDGEVEIKTTHLVPSQALDDAMELVKKHKMADWNKCDYSGISGRKIVCKFIWKGELVRVSSENMPEDGKAVFADIRSVLYGYIDAAAISEKSENDFVATLKVFNVVRSTMAMPTDKSLEEPEKEPNPEIITVRTGSLFYGFTVTEVKDDYVRFNDDVFRYIVNNGPIEKEFIIHKGETLRLDMVDILDAENLTVVELLDVTAFDR